MKKPRNRIPDAVKPVEAPMFTTWAKDKGPDISSIGNNAPIFRSVGSNLVRDAISRESYNSQRPHEAPSSNTKEAIRQCMVAYKEDGLLHNVIDLMADFASQGIEIVHPNKKIEKYLQYWGKKIDFVGRSERFLNTLLRTGNVIVQKSTVKLKQKDIDNLQRGQADADVEVGEPLRVNKNEIPWGYVIHNPLDVEIIGGDEIALFTGKVNYGLRINPNILSRIQNPKNAEDRLLIQSVPDYVINAAKTGKRLLAFTPDKIQAFHYKKDDWEAWADPLARPILKNLMMLEKLRLADLAALDGAISHVRLWKLGSLEYQIYPTDAAVSRLGDMLASAVGGGAIDIIWGPELTIEETSTDIYKFLGIEKYKPTLIAIYDGLGIPLALTGYASDGGLTNNFLSLKTLTQRLEYIRGILTKFWEAELLAIQKAHDFRLPASIRFTRMTLTDEAAEKALLIQLADRNLISVETLQERFGEIPELETLRQNREDREREAGRRPKKAGQWFDALHEEGMQKIALQSGQATPSEVGLNLKPRKAGEKSVVEHEQELKKSQLAAKKVTGKGQSGQGRPKGKKDSAKRAPKKVGIQKARAEFTNAFMWTQATQKTINDILQPALLASAGKKSMRSIADEEANTFEKLKFTVLCNLPLYADVTEDVVANLVSREEPLTLPAQVDMLYKRTFSKFASNFNREPTIEEVRQIQASVYALFTGDYNGES